MMELVSVYIDYFKGVLGSYINLNSAYYSVYSEKVLHVMLVGARRKYYNRIASTLLIGKNGSGKSTILDFIESFHSDSSSSGFLLWKSNDDYIVQLRNYPRFEVESDFNVRFSNHSSHFYYMNDIVTVKINNNIDFYSHIFKSPKNKLPNLIDLSLASISDTTEAKSNEIRKILSLVHGKEFIPASISEKYISFRVTLSFYNTRMLHPLTKNPEFAEKHSFELSNYFWDRVESHQERLNVIEKRNDNYPFINFRAFDGYLKQRERDFSLHFYSMMFDKANYAGDIPAPGVQLFHLIPALLTVYLGSLGLEKNTTDVCFMKLLIDVYFSDINNFFDSVHETTLSFTIASSRHKAEQIIESALTKLRFDFDTLSSILTPLNERKVKLSFDGKDVVYKSEDPKMISDVISKIRMLPKYLEDDIHFSWEGLSSGQISNLHFYARLHDVLIKLRKQNNRRRNIVILIDEIDLYLHPELQRVVFTDLLDFITARKGDLNCQVILTTHSPILASDFIPDDIVAISRTDDGIIFRMKLERVGFGSTIDEFMTQGFFLEATIGNRALEKVKYLIDNRGANLTSEDVYIRDSISNRILRKILGADNDKN